MTWSDTPPAAAGHYWLRFPGAAPRMVQVVYFAESKRYEVLGVTSRHPVTGSQYKGARWAGPILEPTE